MRRKEFETLLNSLPYDFTSENVPGMYEECMLRGMIVPGVRGVEKIKYNVLLLSLENGEKIEHEIPAWYYHWPIKIIIGTPENYVFTLQQIQQAILEINNVENGMYDDLREGTKIENLIKYCEMHTDEELPYWMYSAPPNINYLLQIMWEAGEIGGGSPKSIVTTDWICLDNDHPYFAEIRLPAWFNVFFEKLDAFYRNSGVESPTWGHISTLIN